MWADVTVMIPQAAGGARAARAAVAIAMDPFNRNHEVDPYEIECYCVRYPAKNRAECCDGTLVQTTTANPRGMWDVYDGGMWDVYDVRYSGDDDTTTNVLLLPDEGWCEEPSPWGEPHEAWDTVFRAALQRYSERGYVGIRVHFRL